LAAKRKSKSRRKSTSKGKTKSRSKSRSKSKSKSKSRSKKKPFGGYSISFSGRTETLEQVFGQGNVTPSEMTKKIWKFIKAKRLASK
jgi:chromatin remodeling complex protein RSC6